MKIGFGPRDAGAIAQMKRGRKFGCKFNCYIYAIMQLHSYPNGYGAMDVASLASVACHLL